MSVGYGVGDFLALANFAWKLYRSCKEAPDSFRSISAETLSLRALLEEAEEAFGDRAVTPQKKERIDQILAGCNGVLQDLDVLVKKYESLGTQSKRTWDRMRWNADEIDSVRYRLTSNAVMLTGLISTSEFVVEKKLQLLLQEIQTGKREGSVISTRTVESLSKDQRQAWREIRKELEDIGITIEAFRANKNFIYHWLQAAIASGKFDENATEEEITPLEPDANLTVFDVSNFDGTVMDLMDSPRPGTSHHDYSRPDMNSLQSSESNLNRPGASSPDTNVSDLVTVPQAAAQTGRSLAAAQAQRSRLGRLLKNLKIAPDPNESLLKTFQAMDYAGAISILNDESKIALLGQNYLNSALSMAIINSHTYYGTSYIGRGHDLALQTIEMLLNRGADPNFQFDDGQTALFLAVQPTLVVDAQRERGGVIFQALLDGGANIELRDKSGNSVLHKFRLPWRFADPLKALINSVNHAGDTPLHTLHPYHSSSDFDKLCQMGADLDARNQQNETPLFAILKRSNEWRVPSIEDVRSTLDVFFQYGAKVDVLDSRGDSILHFAVAYPNILPQLVKQSANVNLKNKQGQTPLACACRVWNSRKGLYAIRIFLAAGAGLTSPDNNGDTPLHHVMTTDHGAPKGSEDESTKILQLFLTHPGLNLNATNHRGETALLRAIAGSNSSHANVEAKIWLLIDAGADVDLPDAKGQTPLKKAIRSRLVRITRVLLDHGADETGLSAWEKQVIEQFKATGNFYQERPVRLRDPRLQAFQTNRRFG